MNIRLYVLAVILLTSVALGFSSTPQHKGDPVGNQTCCSAKI